jgi:hypothetical protein
MEVHNKLRPPLPPESAHGHKTDALRYDTDTGSLVLSAPQSSQTAAPGRSSPVAVGPGDGDNTRTFHFDNIYDASVTQEEFYEEALGAVVERCFRNVDSTVIVMGPSKGGKVREGGAGVTTKVD